MRNKLRLNGERAHHLTTCEANSINIQHLASLRAFSRISAFVLDADEFLKLFVPAMLYSERLTLINTTMHGFLQSYNHFCKVNLAWLVLSRNVCSVFLLLYNSSDLTLTHFLYFF